MSRSSTTLFWAILRMTEFWAWRSYLCQVERVVLMKAESLQTALVSRRYRCSWALIPDMITSPLCVSDTLLLSKNAVAPFRVAAPIENKFAPMSGTNSTSCIMPLFQFPFNLNWIWMSPIPFAWNGFLSRPILWIGHSPSLKGLNVLKYVKCSVMCLVAPESTYQETLSSNGWVDRNP